MSFSCFSKYILSISLISNYLCYIRGVRQGKTKNQNNDQQEETAHYQCQNIEIADQEHAYEKPRPPTNETLRKHESESQECEEIQENQSQGAEYQKVGENAYLTPVFQQNRLPFVINGN